MGIFSFLLGSRSKQRTQPPPGRPPPPPPPQPPAPDDQGGFVDLDLEIRFQQELPDGSRTLHAFTTVLGREIGLAVVLGATWEAGSLGPDVPLATYQGTVTYQSLGAPSDAFVRVLDRLYGTRLGPARMRPSTVFTGVSLGGEPHDLEKGPTRIKLFHESDDEELYAELFTNIDLARGVLEIHEKDPDYRPAMLKALRAGP
jgi:hypothetical protein